MLCTFNLPYFVRVRFVRLTAPWYQEGALGSRPLTPFGGGWYAPAIPPRVSVYVFNAGVSPPLTANFIFCYWGTSRMVVGGRTFREAHVLSPTG